MNRVHAGSVLAQEERQFLRDQRQRRVHGKERVLAHQKVHDALRSLHAQLIEIDGAYEAQAGDRRHALQIRRKR